MTRQKKLQDPTEAAMSAIEEALRLDQPKGDAETGTAAEPKLPMTADTDLKIELPRVEAAAPVQSQQAAPPPQSTQRPLIAPDTSRVANDDRRDSSSLVQAFSARPSLRPYWSAATALSPTASPSVSPPSVSASGRCWRCSPARP
jgi:hypothetical protein